jgi:hypothetical protein
MVIAIIAIGTWLILTILAVSLCWAAGHAEEPPAPILASHDHVPAAVRVRTRRRARGPASARRPAPVAGRATAGRSRETARVALFHH